MKKLLLIGLLAAASGASAAGPHKLAYEKDNAVWVANIDGSAAKKISRGQCPDLSPDGSKLVFNTVQADGKPSDRHIAVADLASGKVAVLKDIPGNNCMEPVWSPDGKQILFCSYVDNDRHICFVNADGSDFRDTQKSDPGHKNYWSATWAADGKSIFCQDMENLYRLDLDAKVLKKWKVGKLVPGGSMGGNIRLQAAPDGKTLLMDVGMDEKTRKGWDDALPSIWLLNLATDKAVRLTPKTMYAWDCHWLDAGDILYTSQPAGDENPSIYRTSLTSSMEGPAGRDSDLITGTGFSRQVVKDAITPSAAP